MNVDIKELKRIRNYFGENDRTTFEHHAYAFLDNYIKKLESDTSKAVDVDALVSAKFTEMEEIQKQLGILKTENEKLKFMIDNGLGWQDMVNDITYPRT